MLGFLEKIINYAIPLWEVGLILLITFLIGYVVLLETLKGFIPSLERSSKSVIENNIVAVDNHFELLKVKFDGIDRRLDEMVSQHNIEMNKGTIALVESHQFTLEILEVLKESMNTMTIRVEAIKVLETEIIKLKNIIKRKNTQG